MPAREYRNVGPRRNRNMDGVIFPLALVILRQAFSQAVRFYPNDRVLARVELVL